MLKKVLKYLVWTVAALAGLLVLLSILVYLPPVQNFIKNKAAEYVSQNLGMQLSVERFRLRFPVTVSVDGVVLIDGADTLLSNGSLDAQVALWPLLRGTVKVRQLALQSTAVHYRDSISGMNLRANVGSLSLSPASFRFRDNAVALGTATISDGQVLLETGPDNSPQQSADSVSAEWYIELDELSLQQIDFRMRTSPEVRHIDAAVDAATLRDMILSTARSEVSARELTLEGGRYAYLTDTLTIRRDSATVVEAVTDTTTNWTVRLDRVELRGNALDYGVLNGEARQGFDMDHVALSGIDLVIDSVCNRGTDVAFALRSLSLSERSGLKITEGQGGFSIDSTGIAVSDFGLQTTGSQVRLEARTDAGILNMNPATELSAEITSDLALSELLMLFPVDARTNQIMTGRRLTLEGEASGRLSMLDLQRLTARIDDNVDLRASGSIGSLHAPDSINGNVNFEGGLNQAQFVLGFIPDTALRRRVALPGRLTFNGDAAFSGDRIAPNLTIAADTGRLNLIADVNTRSEAYSARVDLSDFPLQYFLPQDTLGPATLSLHAAGRRFDPRSAGAVADVNLDVEQFLWKGYDYGTLRLDASLADRRFTGSVASASSALELALDLSGRVAPDDYAARVTGAVTVMDMQQMGLAQTPMSLALQVDLEGAMSQGNYMVSGTLDSVNAVYGNYVQNIPHTTVDARATPESTTARLSSGDLSLDFSAPIGIDSLTPYLARLSDEAQRQLQARYLDMELMQQAVPSFNLSVDAGRDNVVHRILRQQGIDFRRARVRASTTDQRPLSAAVVINSLTTSGLTLDTLNVWMRRVDNGLNYSLRLRNRPGNIEQMALIRVTGRAAGNNATADFYQRDRADSVGFRFGLLATLLDSALRVSLTPDRPIFAYRRWSLNPDNYFTYRFDRDLSADIRLEGEGQHIYISSGTYPEPPLEGVNIDLSGIDIARALLMLPRPPSVGGVVSGQLGFGLDRNLFAVTGNLQVDALSFDGNIVGDIGAEVAMLADSTGYNIRSAELQANGSTVLTASGDYIPGQPARMDLTASLNALPLNLMNAFLPEDVARLAGTASGNFTVQGSAAAPLIDGSLAFSDGRLTVPMIGTSFAILPGTISAAASVVSVSNFGLRSPNNQTLSLDGTLNAGNISQIGTDLRLRARNFQAINSQRTGGSQIYGNALLDVDIAASGRLDALSIRGDVGLLNGTDVTYIMRSDDLALQDNRQDIVTFISFAEMDADDMMDSIPQIRSGGIDMQVNIDIADGVQATMNLNENGSNRVEVAGGGNLAYTLNRQGDSRFTGRYNLSGGTVVYSPPIISQKTFAVNPDSYVEWTGDMLNPVMNITATESVRTTVTREDDSSGAVTFNIIVRIRNSLEDMELAFDLDATDDLSIQRELASLAPEQRSQQAMALLIYNTYSGPGATARVDTNNPLNAFIARELNQWARDNLRGVDVSVGINTVDNIGGGQHTDYSYRVSKSLFDDRIKVTVGGSVSSETVAGQNAADNFVDDIELEYRLSQRDNMFLKAYRYNTQESILEGEVVETGFGFVVRKKMNKLGELFRLRRDPERREQRRAKRELKQQKRSNEKALGIDPASRQRQDDPLATQTLQSGSAQSPTGEVPQTETE